MRSVLQTTSVLGYGLAVVLLVAMALDRPRLDAFYPVVLVTAVALASLVLFTVAFPLVLSTNRQPLGLGLAVLVVIGLAFAVSLR